MNVGNPVLVAALIAWAVAQVVKFPLQYFRKGSWDWSILLRAGGMPSSHSALVTATAHGVGLTEGFDSTLFAFAVVTAMIVIYDATGIRRQAGRHAAIINTVMRELLEEHHLSQERLREVLGHSPLEAFVGMVLGLLAAQLLLGGSGPLAP